MVLYLLFYINIGALMCQRKQQMHCFVPLAILGNLPGTLCLSSPPVYSQGDEPSIEPSFADRGGVLAMNEPLACGGYRLVHHGWLSFVVCGSGCVGVAVLLQHDNLVPKIWYFMLRYDRTYIEAKWYKSRHSGLWCPWWGKFHGI